MTQPQNQQDKEPEGLTREFNFPKPWIRDYNPQIHGIKPGMETPQPSTPPSPQAGQQLPQYPAASPNQPPGNAPQGGPVQWNATGVYGGQAEKQKGLPTWAWTLISAVILIIVLLVLFFVILK
jgi:hypothetical protein